ncbi:NADPH:quinone reductase [Arsukibacterium tuosuense]|uniref:NADPH:quinone reductase n=1 Tax=Arsukibacterium tuosuense TaxID=1323745 RepID=A0A285JH23_9GAMM|nr:NADPH:quinone reductase [Arsukibacterium tuosuense]
MTRTYQRWTYASYGSADKLVLENCTLPSLKPSEILIKVEFSAVNSADIKMLKGKPWLVRLFNGLTKPSRIKTLGLDFSGRVVDAGGEVKDFAPGDSVYGLRPDTFSTHSQYLIVERESLLQHVPYGVSAEHACAGLFGGLSALYFLKRIGVQNSIKKALVYGADSSVGNAAYQILSDKTNSLLRFHGPIINVDSIKKSGFLDGVGSAQKYDLIFDATGKLNILSAVKALSEHGELITTAVSLKLFFISKVLSLMSNKRLIIGIAQNSQEDLARLSQLLSDGVYIPFIDSTYRYNDYRAAFEKVMRQGKAGAVLIKLG